MPKFEMGTLEPSDTDDHIVEAYEASDMFVEDALDWAFEHPTPEVEAAAISAYRESPAYVTAVEDIAAGERSVA